MGLYEDDLKRIEDITFELELAQTTIASIDLLLERAEIYTYIRDFPDAEKDLTKVIQIIENYGTKEIYKGSLYEAYLGMAVITLNTMQNKEKTFADIKKAEEFLQEKDDLSLLFVRANAYMKYDMFDQALTEIEKIKQTEFSDLTYIKLFGDYYLYTKQFKKAIQKYEEILRIDPNDVMTLTQLAEIKTELKDYDSAINYLERALCHCNKKEAKRNYAVVLLLRGNNSKSDQQKKQDLNKASTIAKEILNEDPINLDSICLLGDIEHVLENYQTAIKLYESAANFSKGETLDIINEALAECYSSLANQENQNKK